MRRKLALGSMLCLSAFMILIAIIRTTLAPSANAIIDTSWLFFWQGIEAATAIIMVSITAFPALFGQDGSRASKGKASPKKYGADSEESGGSSERRTKEGSSKANIASRAWRRFNLPSIPSATMTGMRTWVRFEGRDGGTRTPRGKDEIADIEAQRHERGKESSQRLDSEKILPFPRQEPEQKWTSNPPTTTQVGEVLTGARLTGPPRFSLTEHDFEDQEDEVQSKASGEPTSSNTKPLAENTENDAQALLERASAETEPSTKRRLEIEAKRLKLANLKTRRMELEEARRLQGRSDELFNGMEDTRRTEDGKDEVVNLVSQIQTEPAAATPPQPPSVATLQQLKQTQVSSEPVQRTKGKEKHSSS